MASFTAPDGVRLNYEVVGTGPPLLLHLGAGCDSGLWEAAGYLAPLSENFSCIVFDHRGHGTSDHPRGAIANHVDRYAGDVLSLIGVLGLERVSFLGWSNAVVVGLRAAEQHPEAFETLVLFGPIAPPATPEQLQASVETRQRELRARGWWFLLDDMLAAEKQPVPQWMVDRIVATDIEPYIGWSEARPSWNWSPWDALPHIETPTLMLAGELEDPDDLMGKAAAQMPNATRIRIPDREHINAFLASELALPTITGFLARSGALS